MADMWMATGMKNEQALAQSLEEGADPNSFGVGDDTPVMRCAELDWGLGIRVLAAAGADIDRTTERGDSALLKAVISRSPEAVATLCELGANMETPNALGATPATYACYLTVSGSVSTESYVIEDGVKRIVKSTGADEMRLQRLQIMKQLLEAGAVVDVEDNNGFTALTRASQHGALDFARVLVEAGADVGHANGNSYQAIHAAAASGHTDLVRLLLESGASASASDSGGFTPLHDAAASGNAELVGVLVEAGADRSAAVREGWKKITAGMTPADVAEVSGHTELASQLRG